MPELSIIETTATLTLSSEYGPMIESIYKAEPAVLAGLSQQGKSHTQFQYATIDASGPVAGFTLIRNWRAILANIERTRDALEEAILGVDICEIKVARFREKAKSSETPDLLLIKAKREEIKIARIKRSISGAIRKLAAYTIQFEQLEKSIRKELGKQPDEPITEANIEEDEERFHIMKAFEQALIAVRSLGRIDQGNMIFLHDIGINGQHATIEINRYIEAEKIYMNKNPDDVHGAYSLQVEWLKRIAERYAGCGHLVASLKGLTSSATSIVTLRGLVI